MNAAWTDDFDDREEPDWPDDDDDETEVVSCPACGADVYEDAEQCPVCGEYIISSSRHPFAGRSILFVGLGMLGIVAVIVVLVLFGF